MMAEVGNGAVRDGDLDPRLKRGGENCAVAAVGVADHADPAFVDKLKCFQIIDQPRGVPNVFAMDRPVRELFVEVRGVVRAATWFDPFAIAKVIRRDSNEPGLHQVNCKRHIWVWWAAGGATGKPHGRVLACTTAGSVKANHCGCSPADVLRNKE